MRRRQKPRGVNGRIINAKQRSTEDENVESGKEGAERTKDGRRKNRYFASHTRKEERRPPVSWFAREGNAGMVPFLMLLEIFPGTDALMTELSSSYINIL